MRFYAMLSKRCKSVYRRIRDLREDRDLKQRQLAEQLGCSQKTYSDYETGKTHVPVEILMGLSEIYGTSVDYLVALTDEKNHIQDRTGMKGCFRIYGRT